MFEQIFRDRNGTTITLQKEENDAVPCALCAEKDRTIAALTDQIAAKDEIIQLLKRERTSAQSLKNVSDAAAG